MASAPDQHDDDGPGPDGPRPDEVELEAAFDRLSPQGSLPWITDDAARRLAEPLTEPAAVPPPWAGLPPDIWGEDPSASTKASRRLLHHVLVATADRLADDARAVDETRARADEARHQAVVRRLEAAADAVRFLVARVERLEARDRPVDQLLPGGVRPLPVPDLSAWADAAPAWFGTPDPDRLVVVGEPGAGDLPAALVAAGHRVRLVTAHGASVWEAPDRVATDGVVLGDVAEYLERCEPGTLAGAVVAGTTDSLDLPAQVALARAAVEAVGDTGVVAVLTTDRTVWDGTRSPVERDLAPGRPLHPETWLVVLDRLGLAGVNWLRPDAGPVHAVVGTVER